MVSSFSTPRMFYFHLSRGIAELKNDVQMKLNILHKAKKKKKKKTFT